MSKAADRAYHFIRGEILSGAMTPGEQLREETLAEACGVSRTPVREAMRKLEAENLIQRSDSQRSFVATLSVDDIAESFALRAMLEGHAAARATDRIKPGQLATLFDHNAAIRDAVARETPDIAAFIEHNRGFHTVVTDAAGSERLTRLLASIVEQPVVLRTARRYDRAQLERSAAEHEELVVAFRHRDPDWAKAVMIGHIRRAFHVYSDALTAPPRDPKTP
ncbi:GntR family transcriptional regulator [Sphingomonas psychrolutea]|uniref:GntR family transcriptional regulator n=1 Tax=Sphingomonas psychrolutea TaxID=1259676 RepID=A0ABQ1H3E0_9SPHN|nr:GntR family transcriptional regulator [Sphingomonas psychrolutea]GGA56128.1 GntR family transcriptional regulator [Sphingomonas psychrolutea]